MRTIKHLMLFNLCSFLSLLIAGSCNGKGEATGNKSMTTQAVEDTSACISLQGIAGCGWGKVCPSDTLMYKAVRLMTYVDSNLAEAEDKALRPMCGSAVTVLADSDSIEAYAFTYGSGASFQDVAIYIKREGERFVEMKNFNEEHAARRIQALDKYTNGLRNFLVVKVYVRDEMELAFNRKSFDTIYYRGIPYEEYKKADIERYGIDTVVQMKHGGEFKFVTEFHQDFEGCSFLRGFEKMYDGEYQYMGYFLGLPDPEYYELHNDRLVLKVFGSIGCGGPETRLHYWDGKKYIGKLIAESLWQEKKIREEKIAVHPEYQLEYFTDN